MPLVLLADDEKGFLDSVTRALTENPDLDLSVIAASDIEEAIDVIDNFWEDLDFLITDYDFKMGTINGIDIVWTLHQDYPSHSTTTILWSGLDRTREVLDSKIQIDHVIVKSDFKILFDILKGKG